MESMSLKFGKFVLAAAATLLVATGPAFAQATDTSGGGGGGQVAQQTCDSSVWQTMEARATMETEREIMQNQNLIYKPDSVLQYTCFDSFAAHASKYVGPIFTHSTRWSGYVINWGSSDPGLDDSISKAAVQSMKTYLTNHDHAPLGGRGEELNLQKYNVQDVGSQGRDYSCAQMAPIWNAAKCYNFMQTSKAAANDGFYPFKTLNGMNGGQSAPGYNEKNDVRQFPQACNNPPKFQNGRDWAGQTEYSRNEKDVAYKFNEPTNQAFTDVRKLVEPGQCEKSIPTGVKVILAPNDTSGYDDGVCPNPGCTYTKGGNCTKSSGS